MADPKPVAKPRKVIDITEPGKSAPPPSAKPIIVTNRPVLRQDPMMMPAPTEVPDGLDAAKPISRVAKPITIAVPASEPDAQSAATVAVSQPRLTIKPLPPAAPAALPAEAPSPDPVKTAMSPLAPVSAGPKAAPAVAAAPLPPKQPEVPKPPAPEPDKDEAEKVPEVAADSSIPDDDDHDQAGMGGDEQLAPNKALEDEKKKEEERQAAIAAEQEKIIESRQYYLPISADARRHGNLQAFLLLVLVLLGVAVWLDVVLDAGIVKFGNLHALTHFFHS